MLTHGLDQTLSVFKYMDLECKKAVSIAQTSTNTSLCPTPCLRPCSMLRGAILLLGPIAKADIRIQHVPGCANRQMPFASRGLNASLGPMELMLMPVR